MNKLIKFLLNTIILALTFLFGQRLFSGIGLDNLTAAFVAAIVLGLVNTIIKPILMFFSIPIRVATFGFFTLVINTFAVLITAFLVDGFSATIIAAFLLSIILSLVEIVTDRLFKDNKSKDED